MKDVGEKDQAEHRWARSLASLLGPGAVTRFVLAGSALLPCIVPDRASRRGAVSNDSSPTEEECTKGRPSERSLGSLPSEPPDLHPRALPEDLLQSAGTVPLQSPVRFDFWVAPFGSR